MTKLIISEIFGPTLQGEGAQIGVPSIFVRTGGCDFRCRWCDSLFAVQTRYKDEWRKCSTQSVMQDIELLSDNRPMWVTLTGGNPALQDFSELIALGQDKGYRFNLETQGSIVKPWFHLLSQMTLSPKPPSSGMAFSVQDFEACIDACNQVPVAIKIVIDNDEDLVWAYDLYRQYPRIPFYLQPCNPLHETDQALNNDQLLMRLDALKSQCFEMKWYDVFILPQLHVLLWGQTRGR